MKSGLKKVFSVLCGAALALSVMAVPGWATSATSSIKVSTKVTNEVQGETPSTASTFTFTMTAGDNANPMPDGSTGGSKTATVSGAGTADFGYTTYSTAGTYNYTIAQAVGSETGYTYDSRTFTMTVTVSADGNGVLSATKSILDNSDGSKVTSMTFQNKYSTSTTSSSSSSTSGSSSSSSSSTSGSSSSSSSSTSGSSSSSSSSTSGSSSSGSGTTPPKTGENCTNHWFILGAALLFCMYAVNRGNRGWHHGLNRMDLTVLAVSAMGIVGFALNARCALDWASLGIWAIAAIGYWVKMFAPANER